MELLRSEVASCRHLPPPREAPAAWYDFMLDEAMWSDAVKTLFFVGSVCDRQASSPETCIRQWTCAVCSVNGISPCFQSAKALAMHCRIKHGVKNPMRFFVDSDGVCPCCKTNFQTRLRCLAHLSDTRRPKCRDEILPGAMPPLTIEAVRRLDDIDRNEQRKAWRSGHSQPLATTPAVTATGRLTGRVQQ